MKLSIINKKYPCTSEYLFSLNTLYIPTKEAFKVIISEHTREKIAEICGVSTRTVEGWEQGRKPNHQSMILLKKFLENNQN